MSGTQKLVGGVLLAVLVLVLIFATAADPKRPEGHTGSYLGRDVADAADGRDDALRSRAATQRF